MGGVSSLNSGQFSGGFILAEAPTLEGGQSTYEGSIAVTLIPRNVAEAALPAGFALAKRADDDGVVTHPIVHMIGFQGSPMLLLNGNVMPAPDPGYTELIILIPYVVKQGGNDCWHSFVVRMYLNDEAAIFIGNAYYSYRKEFAAFEQNASATHTSAEVWPFLRGDVFKSAVTRAGEWTPVCGGETSVPLFEDVKTLLEMPLLGVLADASSQTVCSYWEWDFRCAEVAAATSDHNFLAEVAHGTEDWVGAGGLSNPAMLVRGLRWRIPLPPEQCQF